MFYIYQIKLHIFKARGNVYLKHNELHTNLRKQRVHIAQSHLISQQRIGIKTPCTPSQFVSGAINWPHIYCFDSESYFPSVIFQFFFSLLFQCLRISQQLTSTKVSLVINATNDGNITDKFFQYTSFQISQNIIAIFLLCTILEK